jgi:hypothetical protein
MCHHEERRGLEVSKEVRTWIFWGEVVMLCRLVYGYQPFGGTLATQDYKVPQPNKRNL